MLNPLTPEERVDLAIGSLMAFGKLSEQKAREKAEAIIGGTREVSDPPGCWMEECTHIRVSAE